MKQEADVRDAVMR